MRLVLLGPPGAGKGTQATRIVERFGLTHISTGDIFRANIKNETELGKKVKDILASGALVPDELTIDLVKDRLSQDDAKGVFLLDGFPRNIAQAKALDAFLAENGEELDLVVNIAADKDILVKRLAGRRVCSKCGHPYHATSNPPKVEKVCDACGGEVIQRADDNEKTVLDRIEVYESQTAPLIDYYTSSDKIFNVDGTLDVEVVFDAISNALSAEKE